VPAIRDFLLKNMDLSFDASGREILGHSSVRSAMFAALQQIDGPAALALSVEVLQTTADPTEIALLARNLERQAPEQYREVVREAAREALALASKGKLDGSDVAPLFDLLKDFGGPGVIGDLEEASRDWKYYATITLGHLPEGAGVPALVSMVQEPTKTVRENVLPALQMLAQVSIEHSAARSALIEKASSNTIPDNYWPYLGSALKGDQFYLASSVPERAPFPTRGPGVNSFHLEGSNQNYYSAPASANWTGEQINQQVAVIDELLAVTSSPVGIETMQKSRTELLNRLSQVAAISSNE
jgi:hypothetical protein